MLFEDVIQLIGRITEALGVGVIVVEIAIVSVTYLLRLRKDAERAYREYRRGLGRSILLGLEILVARLGGHGFVFDLIVRITRREGEDGSRQGRPIGELLYMFHGTGTASTQRTRHWTERFKIRKPPISQKLTTPPPMAF